MRKILLRDAYKDRNNLHSFALKNASEKFTKYIKKI